MTNTASASQSQTSVPAWLASQIAARQAETVVKVVTRTRDEHLAYVAAQQATKGLVWSDKANDWVKWYTV